MRILALDGHDAAGKTTLAARLAERIDGRYVRPFGGSYGSSLIDAYKRGRDADVLAIGHEALSVALAAAAPADRLVLDRSWVTVGTLVPAEVFAESWRLWIPTALIWCDLETTLARLSARSDEEMETREWHARFLDLYLARFKIRPGPVIRSDLEGEEQCSDRLMAIYDALPPVDPEALAAGGA